MQIPQQSKRERADFTQSILGITGAYLKFASKVFIKNDIICLTHKFINLEGPQRASELKFFVKYF